MVADRPSIALVALLALLLGAASPAGAVLCGDANGDGLVSDTDGVLALRAAAGLASACTLAACDADGDGALTDSDAVNVLRLAASLPAQQSCSAPPTPLAALAAKLDTLRWIAYAPTGFDPTLGCPAGFPSEAGIRTDLEALRARGFMGVVTFAADCVLDEIPRLAREVGFEGVIMGVFMLNETLRLDEVANAVGAAAHVDGYGIGNEGLMGCGGDRYDAATLAATMDEIRGATGKPVTTSEQIEDYLGGGCLDGLLLTLGDWLFPIAHPFNNGIRAPAAGVAFATERFDALRAGTAKNVFFKETGWPTGGDPAASEVAQAAFFRALRGTTVRYAAFEAFDQPFKASFPLPWEPFWGLLRQDRTPKAFLADETGLSISAVVDRRGSKGGHRP